MRLPTLIAAPPLVLLGLLAAPAGALADPLDDLPPSSEAVYRAVDHNGRIPTIGPIKISGGTPRFAKFSVTYPGVLRPGVKADVVSKATLVVARKTRRNGQPRGTKQSTTVTRTLGRNGGKVRYRIPLTSPARATLAAADPAARKRLVRVETELALDVTGDGRADHSRRAARTMTGTTARAAGGADNTIALELINATRGPIHNVALPVICMYDYGNEGSSVSSFNAVQGATIASGGSIVSTVAADGDAFDTPDFQAPIAAGDLADDRYEALDMGADALNDLADGFPGLGTLESALALVDGCNTNASIFMFTAAQANTCAPGNANCNASTTGAWVMSETTHDNSRDFFAPPIDSAVAGAITEDSTGGDPWGANSATALSTLAGKWATYVDIEACNTPPYGQMVGDDGLSWALNGSGLGWELVVYDSGATDGWSGGNPGSPWESGNPSWQTKFAGKNPMCQGSSR